MSELRIVRGNTFYTRVTITARDAATGNIVERFDLNDCGSLAFYAVRRNRKEQITNYTILSENVVRIKWTGSDMKVGGYGLEGTGTFEGLEWRFYDTERYVFNIVESNEEANVPASAFIETDYYQVNTGISLISSLNGAQADWNQTDNTEPDYIKNKPTALSDFEDDLGNEPAHTHEQYLEEDDLAAVAISGDYNDLANTPTIPTDLADLNADSTHRVVTDTEKSTWNGKQDAISDLSVIRSGAAAGATAYQKPSSGIPKSDLASAIQTSLDKADSALQSFTEEDPIYSASAAAGITSSDITSWDGKYTKPTNGIPKTDLASGVQTSLGLADTALQSYTETDPVFTASAAHGITSSDITSWNGKQDALVSGTNIKTVNNQSLLGSGNITIESGSQITVDSAMSSTSENPVQNKVIYEELGDKQDALVSGTNIKTINNQSILGSGNITIEGGGVTVNDATLTIQKEGTSVGTFTANASTNSTINIVETDPVFVASAAHGITSSDITNWNNSPVLGDDDGQASDPDFDAYTDTVWHTEQTLSAAQKLQARTNIGAADASAVVTSFNGSVGAITYTAPVSSVNGSTGAVTVQETLVSGTNIKTINNTSLLGSGDITISGGGGTIDSALDTTSTNAVQNAVIATALNGKVGSSTITTIVSISQSAYDALASKDSATLYVITS